MSDPIEGEILPPSKEIVPEPCPLEEGVRITVDLIAALQEGGDPFFKDWTNKWEKHKKSSPRDNWAIDGTDEITARDKIK